MSQHEAHEPVLVDRIVDLLSPALVRPGAVVVDGTLGLGGHSAALLRRVPTVTVVGIDRDAAALAAAQRRLEGLGDLRTWQGTYDELATAVLATGAGGPGGPARVRVDAVLLDLGVSSMQIDDPARGFSYARDVPLDMRMDPTDGPTAADVLRTYPREALARVFREYGEERFAQRIATAVVRARDRSAIESSAQLADIVEAAVPAPARRSGHPAKRVFQALRIEVNDELRILDSTLPAALAMLRPGGRMAVLAYHSLEDRRVKRAFAALATIVGPDGRPLPPPVGDPYVRILTRSGEQAGPEEVHANPRAASARLRAVEKLREGMP